MAVVLVFVVILAVVSLPFLVNANQFRPHIESMLSNGLGREVRLGQLRLSLFSGRLSVGDITIMDNPEFSDAPFVTASSLYIGVELKPLIFSKKVHITEISLERPSIYLLRIPDGEWNFSDLGATKADAVEPPKEESVSVSDIKVGRLRITDGRVEVIEPRKKTAVYEKVNLSVDNLSYDSASPFTFWSTFEGYGLLNFNGNFGPLSREDTLLTPFAAVLKIIHLDPAVSGFIPAGTGLSGLFDFEGEANSNKGVVRSKGKASIANLRLVAGDTQAVKTVLVDYDLLYDLNNKTGTLTEATVGFGQAAMRLSGDFDAGGNVAFLNMNLKGNGVPLEDIQELLPALGITLPKGAAIKGGTLNTEIAAEGFLNDLSMDGSVEISGTRLAGFDLGDKLKLVAQAAGLKSAPDTLIEKLSAALGWSATGIAVSDIQLIIPAIGELSGSGTISPRQELDFSMRAAISPGALEEFTQGLVFNINFFVRGNALEPEFVPDYKNAALSLIDAVFSGKGTEDGEEKPGNRLINNLKGIFGNK